MTDQFSYKFAALYTVLVILSGEAVDFVSQTHPIGLLPYPVSTTLAYVLTTVGKTGVTIAGNLL